MVALSPLVPMPYKSAQMGSCPITFLWLWPVTGHEPHSLHVTTDKIWRRSGTTPWSAQSYGWNQQRPQHSPNENKALSHSSFVVMLNIFLFGNHSFYTCRPVFKKSTYLFTSKLYPNLALYRRFVSRKSDHHFLSYYVHHPPLFHCEL